MKINNVDIKTFLIQKNGIDTDTDTEIMTIGDYTNRDLVVNTVEWYWMNTNPYKIKIPKYNTYTINKDEFINFMRCKKINKLFL